MALLISFFLWFSAVPPLTIFEDSPFSLYVFYDIGNPDNSVAILNGTILKKDDLYEDLRTLTFEPEAIVMIRVATSEPIKFTVQGEIEPRKFQEGQNLFVVQQLKAIYDAQVKFLQDQKNSYAPDLETLIHFGYLADGFTDFTKQGYQFSVAEVGETKRLAPHYDRQPTFLAIAESTDEDQGQPYFSIDHLGQVRYAETRGRLTWGPVWEYQEHDNPVPYRYLGLEPNPA